MSINGQGHSLTLVKGHSDFKVKCLNLGLYTQVSDSGPLGPLVVFLHSRWGFEINKNKSGYISNVFLLYVSHDTISCNNGTENDILAISSIILHRKKFAHTFTQCFKQYL